MNLHVRFVVSAAIAAMLSAAASAQCVDQFGRPTTCPAQRPGLVNGLGRAVFGPSQAVVPAAPAATVVPDGALAQGWWPHPTDANTCCLYRDGTQLGVLSRSSGRYYPVDPQGRVGPECEPPSLPPGVSRRAGGTAAPKPQPSGSPGPATAGAAEGLFGSYPYPSLLEALPDVLRGAAMLAGLRPFTVPAAVKSGWVCAGLAGGLALGETKGAKIVSEGKFKRRGMKLAAAIEQVRVFDSLAAQTNANAEPVTLTHADVEALEVIAAELQRRAREAK